MGYAYIKSTNNIISQGLRVFEKKHRTDRPIFQLFSHNDVDKHMRHIVMYPFPVCLPHK